MASNIKVDIVKPTATNGSLSLKGDSGGSATANGITVDSSGNTSITGTFTSKGIDDNASSTALTIDASGNVQLANSLTAGTLGSGVVFPAGHIIQTVSYTGYTTSSTTNSQTLQRDTSFSATINNVLANSYVLILTSYEASVGTVSPNTQQQLNHAYGLFRDTTNIFQSATDVYYNNPQSGADVYGNIPVIFYYLDTSPATGTNVYYNGIRTHTTSYYTSIQGGSTDRFITLFEIAQ